MNGSYKTITHSLPNDLRLREAIEGVGVASEPPVFHSKVSFSPALIFSAAKPKKQIPLTSLDLKAIPGRTQITCHDCVEGWSAIAKWRGVPLSEISKRVQPEPSAQYVVFYCMDTDRRGITTTKASISAMRAILKLFLLTK